MYGGSQEYSAAEYYKRALDIELTSALLNHQINIKDIKDSNYQITRSTDSFINKKLLEEKHPPEFEGRYSIKDSQFSKVRITYNKEFLPTKIEWYYKGEEGLKWYTWRTYSYPFKNKSDFDKKLIRGSKYDSLNEPIIKDYHVRFYDLDMNGHVNNSKYLDWIFEVMGADFLTQYIPKKINLKYVKEVRPGGVITSAVERTGLETKHEITSDGATNAQAIITWQEMKKD